LRIFGTMNWVDDWLHGLVHRSVRSDPAERGRHERFLVARTVAPLVAFAALPPYLIGRVVPTAIECLAVATLAVALAAAFMLSRKGRLLPAQLIVSVALSLLVGAGLAAGGPRSMTLLLLLAIPFDAFLAASARAATLAFLVALVGVPLSAWLLANFGLAREDAVSATLAAIAVAVGFGHVCAKAVGDHRLKAVLQGALRSGEARESAALQSIDDLVTLHDRNGSVLRANSAASKLVGVPCAALHGRGLFARIHVSDRPIFLKAVSDAATASEPVVAQFRLQVGAAELAPESADLASRLCARNAPTTIWVEMRANRLSTPGEEGATVVAVTRDISQHKQHADAIDALRREAERAGEDRAQLLATVSHELRTPLTALIGYAELLTGRGGTGSGDKSPEYALIIRQSGEHMLDVVNTLLDLSTIEAGRYGIAPEPLDTAELVRDACKFMSLMADRAGVTLVQEVAGGLPALRADRRACQQILLNLLSNALKFTPVGGLVTVEARREGERIQLIVRDTGIGVCEAELSRLGVPFFQAASARGRSAKGSGLGLSVVRGLVGLHGGRVSFSSAPGNGTSVTVSLPIDADHPRAALPAPVHNLASPANGPPTFQNGIARLA
jgi:two-component system, cell cycle sensor histidine kinase DivJ